MLQLENIYIIFLKNFLNDLPLMWIGDWGVGRGGWGAPPTPKTPTHTPQTPIPNPQYIYIIITLLII